MVLSFFRILNYVDEFYFLGQKLAQHKCSFYKGFLWRKLYTWLNRL